MRCCPLSCASLLLLPALLLTLAESARASDAWPEMKVEGRFKAPVSSDPGKSKPRGISGMACLGKPGDAERQCLTVNDEELSGEIVTLTPTTFRIDADKDLIPFVFKGDTQPGVFGPMPPPRCKEPGQKKFKELDGEGIALSGGNLYVVGSHACGRTSGEFKPSTFLLVRFPTSSPNTIAPGEQPGLQRTYRLSEILPVLPDPTVGDKFDEIQRKVEGLAVIDGRLYAGLRTPNEEGFALIVSAPAEALFAKGDAPLSNGVIAESKSREIRVRLDRGNGIRDMAALGDGGLLLLTGPATTESVPFRLFRLPPVLNLRDLVTPIPLGDLPTKHVPGSDEIAKAETPVVLDESGNKGKVLILYDNVDEGAPTPREIDLKR
jgi:hypothetical protein